MKTTRWATGLLALAVSALVVGDLQAQDREGRRRGGPGGGFGRGPGGGFGGFGGGFSRGGPGRGQTSVLGLLRIDEVQEELDLMEDQKEPIKKLMSSVEDKQRELLPERGDFRNFREMSEEERRDAIAKMQEQRSEMEEKREEIEAEAVEQLETVLLPDQMERLEQIRIQVQGPMALRDEDVAKKLNLTSDQKEQLSEIGRELAEEMSGKMREIFQSRDISKMQEMQKELREKAESKTAEVLTEEQRKQFAEMKGEPFEMPERRGGFGRGGRGDRGGEGGRGGRRGGGRRDRGGDDDQ